MDSNKAVLANLYLRTFYFQYRWTSWMEFGPKRYILEQGPTRTNYDNFGSN